MKQTRHYQRWHICDIFMDVHTYVHCVWAGVMPQYLAKFSFANLLNSIEGVVSNKW